MPIALQSMEPMLWLTIRKIWKISRSIGCISKITTLLSRFWNETSGCKKRIFASRISTKRIWRNNQDYLIRWDLKRIEKKRDMIQQQKILANIKIKRFWLTLRGLVYSFSALKNNFEEHKAEKVREEVRNYSSWKIAYRFKVPPSSDKFIGL